MKKVPAAGAKPRNIIGRRLSALRYRHGWSQSFLAAQCQLQGWDIDRFTIARIERGTRWVGDFELLRLAGALGVSAAELLGASSKLEANSGALRATRADP